MHTLELIVLLIAALATGGLMVNWVGLARAMAPLAPSTHVEFHQSTNRTFDPYMPVFGCNCWRVVLVVAYGIHTISGQLSAFGAVFFVAVIAIGVPTCVRINKQVARWSIENPRGDWAAVRARWVRFHVIRTLFSVPAFALYAAAMILRSTYSFFPRNNIDAIDPSAGVRKRRFSQHETRAWRIHKITRQSVSGTARDSASASDTRQNLSATLVRQNLAGVQDRLRVCLMSLPILRRAEPIRLVRLSEAPSGLRQPFGFLAFGINLPHLDYKSKVVPLLSVVSKDGHLNRRKRIQGLGGVGRDRPAVRDCQDRATLNLRARGARPRKCAGTIQG